MAVEKIYSFLVPPMVGAKDLSSIMGAEIPLNSGKTFDMLEEVYEKSPSTCRIEIAFKKSDIQGVQENKVRSEIVAYTENPNSETALPLAKRLATVTTKRSKLGLFFLVKGTEDGKKRLLIARFPVDTAILADTTSGALNLAFLEQVFLKNAKSFKAAMYEAASPIDRFWMGRATDRQVNASDTEIRAYWVQDFLMSEYRTTSAEGTRRFAAALRDAVKATKDDEVKEEIMAAVKLARNFGGQTMSGQEFYDRFGFTEKTRAAITGHLSDPKVLTDTFAFDVSEFTSQIPYRTKVLNNGASLTAPSENFDNIFQQEIVHTAVGREVKISTTGQVVDQHLGKR